MDSVGVVISDSEKIASKIISSPFFIMLSVSLLDRFTVGFVLSIMNEILSFPLYSFPARSLPLTSAKT